MDYAEILFEKAITRYGPEGDHTGRWEWQAGNHIRQIEAALRMLMDEKIDYMTINKLGDPETQHTIKAARAALSR